MKKLIITVKRRAPDFYGDLHFGIPKFPDFEALAVGSVLRLKSFSKAKRIFALHRSEKWFLQRNASTLHTKCSELIVKRAPKSCMCMVIKLTGCEGLGVIATLSHQTLVSSRNLESFYPSTQPACSPADHTIYNYPKQTCQLLNPSIAPAHRKAASEERLS